ncbi:MAG: ATP-binding protein [Lactobacillaceae bacterium]|jgi:primosomal protein DnaI|nr:ATP-binding protein [Lactobacillaceae bacterium]
MNPELKQSIIGHPEVSAFLERIHRSNDEVFIENNLDSFTKFIFVLSDSVDKDFTPNLELSEEKVVISYNQILSDGTQNIFNLGIDPKLFAMDFVNDFDDSADERIMAYVAVYNFVNSYVEKPDEFQQGPFIFGDFGVGKTHLLALAAGFLSKNGHSVAIVNTSNLIDRLERSEDYTERMRIVGELKSADVLMIDDFGAGRLTDWLRDEVFGMVFEIRMITKKPVLVSSNFDIETLTTDYLTYTNKSNDSVKAARIKERINFLTKEVQMGGINRRNKI